mmetsp:Transcript_1622/g.5103  ORF Transcript_1622/g.5103 Transcript_1622/m.5103 type:complete len:316 (+) Transcript_1622:2319-3266(+)
MLSSLSTWHGASLPAAYAILCSSVHSWRETCVLPDSLSYDGIGCECPVSKMKSSSLSNIPSHSEVIPRPKSKPMSSSSLTWSCESLPSALCLLTRCVQRFRSPEASEGSNLPWRNQCAASCTALLSQLSAPSTLHRIRRGTRDTRSPTPDFPLGTPRFSRYGTRVLTFFRALARLLRSTRMCPPSVTLHATATEITSLTWSSVSSISSRASSSWMYLEFPEVWPLLLCPPHLLSPAASASTDDLAWDDWMGRCSTDKKGKTASPQPSPWRSNLKISSVSCSFSSAATSASISASTSTISCALLGLSVFSSPSPCW